MLEEEAEWIDMNEYSEDLLEFPAVMLWNDGIAKWINKFLL